MLNRLKGVLLLIPLILVLFTGSIPLYITASILTLFALYEFFSSFKQNNYKPFNLIAYSLVFILLFYNLRLVSIRFVISMSIFLFLISMIISLFTEHSILDLAITILGIVYIILPFQLIVLIHEFNQFNPNLTFLIFIIAFCSDSFAYICGKMFGKHKLIPRISPNKTIEGSLGAILCTLVIILIYCFVFDLNFISFSILSILGSILAQLGDLFASSIKRYNGIKDFSNLIIGHGGVLDRFDSILLLTPFIYIYSIFLL